MGRAWADWVGRPRLGLAGCDPGAAWIRGLLSKQPARSSRQGSEATLTARLQEVAGSSPASSIGRGPSLNGAGLGGLRWSAPPRARRVRSRRSLDPRAAIQAAREVDPSGKRSDLDGETPGGR